MKPAPTNGFNRFTLCILYPGTRAFFHLFSSEEEDFP